MRTDRRYENILVIDFGQLGDVVLSLPALSAIRRRFPDAKITVLVGKVPDQVIAMSRLADDIETVDRVELRDGPRLRSIAGIFGIVRNMRRRKFDLVIDLHSLPETNILAFLSGARQRLLANRENRSIDRFSNFPEDPPKENKTLPLAQRYLDALRPLGIKDAESRYHLDPKGLPIDDIAGKYELSGNCVGLFPGAGHPSRCWDLGKFAELAEKLGSDGTRVFVILGPEEKRLVESVRSSFPDTVTVVTGLTIPEFGALASLLSVFVTNDTGPMHIAACAGAPIVLLLDGRAPDTYLPMADRIQVVRAETIDLIPVDDVHQAVISLLNPSTPAPE